MPKVSDIIEALNEYNPDAEITAVSAGRSYEFSLCYGYSNECTKENCERVLIEVGPSNDEKY